MHGSAAALLSDVVLSAALACSAALAAAAGRARAPSLHAVTVLAGWCKRRACIRRVRLLPSLLDGHERCVVRLGERRYHQARRLLVRCVGVALVAAARRGAPSLHAVIAGGAHACARLDAVVPSLLAT